MLKGKAKRSLAFVLAACMLLALLPSFGAGASAASVSYTEVDPSVIDAGCDGTRSVSKMTEIERRGGKRWDKPKKAEKSRDCGGGKF